MFRLMMGAGFIMILVSLVGLWPTRKGRLPKSKWVWRLAIIASRQTHLDFGSRPLRVGQSPTRDTRIMMNPAPIISRNIQYVRRAGAGPPRAHRLRASPHVRDAGGDHRCGTVGGHQHHRGSPGSDHGARDQVTTEVGRCLSGRSLICLLYTSPSPRDGLLSRMPSSA